MQSIMPVMITSNYCSRSQFLCKINKSFISTTPSPLMSDPGSGVNIGVLSGVMVEVEVSPTVPVAVGVGVNVGVNV